MDDAKTAPTSTLKGEKSQPLSKVGKQLISPLRKWYRSHSRELPWRTTHDPYLIWVSEIMLQQTTVKAVIPYFDRFMKLFPSVQDLATASESEVFRAWEGLGYYRRARFLHQAAQVIVTKLNGEFPTDVAGWLSLPGIGRYTAGAIVSFSFDKPAPILEANTVRLYARLLGLQEDVKSTSAQKKLWQFAEAIVPEDRPGEINQALMEIGSQICRPVEPMCATCPLAKACQAYAMNLQTQIPVIKSRVKITKVIEYMVAVERDGKFLLRQRKADERWAGMWDFLRWTSPFDDVERFDKKANPKSHSKSSHTASELSALEDALLLQVGCKLEVQSLELVFVHHVTRYALTQVCVRAHPLNLKTNNKQALIKEVDDSPCMWVKPEEFAAHPLSTSARRFANHLLKRIHTPQLPGMD